MKPAPSILSRPKIRRAVRAFVWSYVAVGVALILYAVDGASGSKELRTLRVDRGVIRDGACTLHGSTVEEGEPVTITAPVEDCGPTFRETRPIWIRTARVTGARVAGLDSGTDR